MLNFENFNDRQIYLIFLQRVIFICHLLSFTEMYQMDWTNQLTLADLNFALHLESFQDYRSYDRVLFQ